MSQFTSLIDSGFDYAQSFFLDAGACENAPVAMITGVDLFFKSIPGPRSISGITNPRVTVALCAVENEEPKLDRVYAGSITQLTRVNIIATQDASVATAFSFPHPVAVATNAYYAILITFDDPDFVLWKHVTGHRLIGTPNVASSGLTGVKTGRLFRRNNSGTFFPESADLKFAVFAARYATSTSAAFAYVPNSYEFLRVSTVAGFRPGERVFQDATNAAGNVTIASALLVTGDGSTDFTSSVNENDFIVLRTAGDRCVAQVSEIINATALALNPAAPARALSGSPVRYARVVTGRLSDIDLSRRRVTLVDSGASNAAFRFTPNSTIIGETSNATASIEAIDSLQAASFRIFADDVVPAGTVATYAARGIFSSNSIAAEQRLFSPIKLNEAENPSNEDRRVIVHSRSTEVAQPGLYSNADAGFSNSSFVFEANVTTSATSSFSSPQLPPRAVDLQALQYEINGDIFELDANGVAYDTEVYGNGLAISRHFTIVVPFAENRRAEDVRLFLEGQRPAGTDIRVYVKIHAAGDPESFSQKLWTPLENLHASVFTEGSEFYEYEYSLPIFPPSAASSTAVFQTALNSAICTGAGGDAYIAPGDVVKVYNSLIPDNYFVAPVAAVNTSAVTLATPIVNNNIVGSGLKIDRLLYKHTAFNDLNESGIATYFNGSLSQYRAFTSMQYKIVLLSNDVRTVPRVNSIQAIGVSV